MTPALVLFSMLFMVGHTSSDMRVYYVFQCVAQFLFLKPSGRGEIYCLFTRCNHALASMALGPVGKSWIRLLVVRPRAGSNV